MEKDYNVTISVNYKGLEQIEDLELDREEYSKLQYFLGTFRRRIKNVAKTNKQ